MTALSAERILVAAEDALRRFGPAKATVSDVARALGVSHASVYRHFASKAALRDAVMRRWLARFAGPLGAIADARETPAPERLWQWFDALRAAKRATSIDDRELFAAYHALSGEVRGVVDAYVADLVGQLTTIVRDGIAAEAFRDGDAATIARALFLATSPFHTSGNAAFWGTPQDDADYAAVRELLDASLRPASAARPLVPTDR